jgi:hypothetical protein
VCSSLRLVAYAFQHVLPHPTSRDAWSVILYPQMFWSLTSFTILLCVCVCEYFIHYFGTQVLDRSTMTVASSMVTCERLFPTLIPNPTNGIRKRVGTTTSGPNKAATCSHASRPRLAFNVLLLCHDGYTSTLLATDTSTHPLMSDCVVTVARCLVE